MYLEMINMFDISIHALRGEGDYYAAAIANALLDISIHALRGEGDLNRVLLHKNKEISIHALRGEGDPTY